MEETIDIGSHATTTDRRLAHIDRKLEELLDTYLGEGDFVDLVFARDDQSMPVDEPLGIDRLLKHTEARRRAPYRVIAPIAWSRRA